MAVPLGSFLRSVHREAKRNAGLLQNRHPKATSPVAISPSLASAKRLFHRGLHRPTSPSFGGRLEEESGRTPAGTRPNGRKSLAFNWLFLKRREAGAPKVSGELDSLKGGWSAGLGVARYAPYWLVQNCPAPSAASCSRMYVRTCSSSNPTVDTA